MLLKERGGKKRGGMNFSQDSLCVTVYWTMCASKHQKVECDSLGTKTELGSDLQEPRG